SARQCPPIWACAPFSKSWVSNYRRTSKNSLSMQRSLCSKCHSLLEAAHNSPLRVTTTRILGDISSAHRTTGLIASRREESNETDESVYSLNSRARDLIGRFRYARSHGDNRANSG